MWTFTVPSVIPSDAPISLLLFPAAISFMTSVSRFVSFGACMWAANCAPMAEGMLSRPLYTPRMDSSNCARGESFNRYALAPALQCLVDVFVAAIGAEHDNLGLGSLLEDRLDGFNAVHFGHAQVQKENVRAVPKKLLKRLPAICRFAHNPHIFLGLNQCADPFPDHGMIIRDGDANLLAASQRRLLRHREAPGGCVRESGAVTSTRVPFPGLLFSVNFPPISFARSRIPISPTPRRAFRTSKPFPSSLIWSRTSFLLKAISIWMQLARACFSALSTAC